MDHAAGIGCGAAHDEVGLSKATYVPVEAVVQIGFSTRGPTHRQYRQAGRLGNYAAEVNVKEPRGLALTLPRQEY